MLPERWKQIEDLYQELADLPSAEQAVRLAQVADAELAAEVRSLLGAGEVRSLVTPALAAVAGSAAAASMPRRFGPWRVTGVIGHGGMGAVYQALRDDRSFEKQVAIKTLHLGLDSPPARERFARERSILATLEHPNIARLLDGGETEDGVSYIVLEYVDGEPITAYCARHKLAREARLDLFRQVCSAVAYAHQKLVIHRDLKPGNILVSRDGVPKLLDFGIAKLLEPGEFQTLTGFLALTPQYASPEQIRGQAVSTASDVYSLGMVLYEVLTGRRPYEVATGSITAIAQTVCDRPPEPPALNADLDNILLMALRKEPERRYGSVREFADDLERARAFRPVRARPSSPGYRMSRFIRRNRVPVAAALLVVGSLSAGLLQTRRAEQRERARFDQVRQLATRFLFDFDRDIRQLPGSTAARERLVSTALQTLNSLAAGSANDPALTAELSQAYVSVGEVQGLPGMLSLGRTADAERSFRKACSLIRPLAERNASPRNPYRRQAAFAYSRLGYLLWRMSRAEEARRWLVEALRLMGDGGDANDLRVAANIEAYLSMLEQQAYQGKRAAVHAARAVERMRRYQAATPGLRARSDLARVMSVAGGAMASAGDLPHAAALLAEVIARREQILREQASDTENRRELAVAHLLLSNILFGAGGAPSLEQPAESQKHREAYLALMRELADEDPKNDSARHDLGLALKEIADAVAASDRRLARHTLREALRVLESRPPDAPARERHIGLLHAVLAGIAPPAEARRELELARRGFIHENPQDGLARGDFLRLWYEQGDYDRVWQALAPARQATAEDLYAAFHVADCAVRLARIHPDEAALWRERARQAWAPWKGRYPAADRALGL